MHEPKKGLIKTESINLVYEGCFNLANALGKYEAIKCLFIVLKMQSKMIRI